MDPLSITASCIAVIGALSVSGKGIGRLIDLRHAPEELQELSNEIESLRALVQQVQQSFMSIHGSQLHQDHADAISTQLQRMRQPVDCLQSLIEFQLRKIDNNGAASSVSKPEWLKAGQKVEQQRLKIRDASSALSVAMNAVNLQLGGQLLRQHALQIHSISMVSQTFEDFQRSVGDGHSALTVQVDKLSSRLEDMAAHAQNPQPRESNAALCNDKAPSTDVGGSLTNSATATSSLHPPRQPVVIPSSKNEQLEEHRTANPALADCPDTKASYVRITASMNVRRYRFPTWAAARALVLSSRSRHIAGTGASWSLRIPIVIEDNDPIWSAAEAGNITFLQSALSRTHNPWIVTKDGETLLLYAANQGHMETSRFLLSQQADTEAEDSAGLTVWHHLLFHKMWEEINEISAPDETLEDILDKLSLTKLHAAAAQVPGFGSVTSKLLENEFRDLNTLDRRGMTPLHWACFRADVSAVQLLLSWSSNTSIADRGGRTCLHYAVRYDEADLVKLLLKGGCAPDVPDVDGRTPLFYAVSAEVVRSLAASGANIEHRGGPVSWTPLLHAATEQHDPFKAVEKLIDLGADSTAVDHYGEDVITTAIKFNNIRTLSVLLRRYKQLGKSLGGWKSSFGATYPHLVGIFASTEIMRVLAEEDLKGLDPTHKHNFGRTATDFFYQLRDQHCTIARPPFEVEEDAWWDLMESACLQNDIDFDTFEPDWWHYYKRNCESEVETLSDGSEGDAQDGEDDEGSESSAAQEDFEGYESEGDESEGDESEGDESEGDESEGDKNRGEVGEDEDQGDQGEGENGGDGMSDDDADEERQFTDALEVLPGEEIG